MASADYMQKRVKYSRPQGMIWSDGQPILSTTSSGLDILVPPGVEIGSDVASEDNNYFLVLSDDNRSPIQIGSQRIEKRDRMINGRMRSYHIADKMTITVSWDMLPSRAYYVSPKFDTDPESPTFGQTTLSNNQFNSNGVQQQFTSDGGAGGVEILDWYQRHTGPFYVMLAYDKYDEFSTKVQKEDDAYGHIYQYSQVKEMYFSSFEHSVERRGNHLDLWNISVTLEEV